MQFEPKNNLLTIDLSTWSTPTNYAKERGIKKNVVSNWIKRGKIEHWYIKELGLSLVKRNSEH